MRFSSFCPPLAVAALALTLSACSNPENGCSQPPLQSYPTPQLVSPTNGSTNVPTNIGSIEISLTSSRVAGLMQLVGPTTTLALQPHAVAGTQGPTLFRAPIPALEAQAAYTIRYTLTYPAGCLAAPIVKASTIAGFVTGN